MKAVVVLEDGKIFYGRAFGHIKKESFGEVVFNTSMSGYQEIITDPSYKGQIVTMTYPLIGNYGVNREDIESDSPKVEGLIVKELCRYPSNYRCEMSLEEYFKRNGIMGVEGIDTRALTRHTRLAGAMKGIISTETAPVEELVEKVKASPGLLGRDLVNEVTCGEPVDWNSNGDYRVAVLDCGVKYNILRALEERGCLLRRFPASTDPAEILDFSPDGIFISNGPGDPKGAPYVHETVRQILGKVPVFGICLGIQMLALATGADTFKLKFGHRGANHPVKDLKTGEVSITSQNHGFCVDMDSVNGENTRITHINLNDNTVEGIENEKLDFFSVQFHPEAGPGPHDAMYLFDRFVDKVKEKAKSRI